MRICIAGRRLSRSAKTTNRQEAEERLRRFLVPLGLGENRLPFCNAWEEYERSSMRGSVASSTLKVKRSIWMHFARWMRDNHFEISDLAGVTPHIVDEYLLSIKGTICAATYNNRVCVLREIFRTLGMKTGSRDNPWEGVRLLANDSHSRRNLTTDELQRLVELAGKAGEEWKTLFLVGIYTGLRLGDCCRLRWRDVDMERRHIQIVPSKTRRHSGGVPVTIPIHPLLFRWLHGLEKKSQQVLPSIAKDYASARWRVGEGIADIFKRANIVMSVRIAGRKNRTPEATFHSLRHTFVSMAANAGVPLHVVQSIVGHQSSSMTRHYYHESEEALRRAICALPNLEKGEFAGEDKPDKAIAGFVNLPADVILEMRRLYGLLRRIVE